LPDLATRQIVSAR